MSFLRTVYQQLEAWKAQPNRKPLILRGARQVGKTTLIRSFGRSYARYVELNLERPEDRSWFERFNQPSELMEALLLARGIPSKDRKRTLLFLDEIQAYPPAIGMLRYFHEELPDLSVVSAGSLLEFAWNIVGSFPVGRVEFLYLHPLNFQEYLQAHGMTLLLEALHEMPLRYTAHPVLLDAFHRYTLVGGMPEVVQAEVKGAGINDLQPIYRNLWSSYLSDTEKYAHSPTELRVLRHVLQAAPQHLDQRITFQGFGNSNYRSREVGEAFRQLDDARFIRLIYPTTSTHFTAPLDLDRKPRLQFLDTGLVHFARGGHSEVLGVPDFESSYRGALIPHIVTQDLMSTLSGEKPRFWVRDKAQSSAEVDLVIPHHGMLLPVEIKSGPTGRLRSLHEFMDRVDHSLAIRLHSGPMDVHEVQTRTGKKFTLLDLPYYLGSLLPLDYLVQKYG